MEILVAKDSGFCRGVQNAIDKAKSIENGCVTLGKLIHNELVIKDLEKMNIKSINSLEEYSSGVLLIRSHGVGKAIYKELKDRNINYVDATCGFVKKIHKIVEDYYNQGYKIIIFGDRKHPEVIGINGWCENSAIVINSEEDISKLNKNDKYISVAQTTFDTIKYKNILKKAKNACNLVEIKDTICYTTTCRQEEALKLSKKCQLMLVIGSKTSSNTSKLFNICKNNTKTYLIETLADLKSVEYKNISTLGIVAGASTPKELIMEVKTQMSESQEKKNVVVENVSEFEKAMAKPAGGQKQYKPGHTYTVTVASADDSKIILNLKSSSKIDAIIEASEAELDGVEYNKDNYKEGDELQVKYIKTEKGFHLFSKKACDLKAKEDAEAVEYLSQPTFKIKIAKASDGGLNATFKGMEIFIPSSEVKANRRHLKREELEKYVGKELVVTAIKSKKDKDEDPIVKSGKTVYASSRRLEEEKKAAQEAALWEYVYEGNVISGKVTKLVDFGAFVKVKKEATIECLAHVSNLSHKKNVKPEDVLEVGKTYEFLVLNVNKEKKQVGLGFKQLHKSLYEEAVEKYPVGSTIKGVVANIQTYGIYVQIEDGVDGLVPIAEMSNKFVKRPEDICKVGDEVEAVVTKFDAKQSKIALSMKALIPEEKEEITEEEYIAAQEKRNARNLKKFDNVDAPKKRSSRKAQEEVEEETVSYTSDSSESISIGQLIQDKFKDLKD